MAKLQQPLPKQPEFNEDDARVALKIKRALEDADSALNHFLQSLAVEREIVISKIASAKKETDQLLKLSGELAGVQRTLAVPQKILTQYDSFLESKDSEKSNGDLMEKMYGARG